MSLVRAQQGEPKQARGICLGFCFGSPSCACSRTLLTACREQGQDRRRRLATRATMWLEVTLSSSPVSTMYAQSTPLPRAAVLTQGVLKNGFLFISFHPCARTPRHPAARERSSRGTGARRPWAACDERRRSRSEVWLSSSPAGGAILGQQFCTLTQKSLIFKGFSCF